MVSYNRRFLYHVHKNQIEKNMHGMTRFRKDQIFFANKREDGSPDLFSLYDYKDFREKMDLEKAYLQGRFDAVPFLSK